MVFVKIVGTFQGAEGALSIVSRSLVILFLCRCSLKQGLDDAAGYIARP